MTPQWKCSLKYFCVLGNGVGTALWWLLHIHSPTHILGNDSGGKAVPTHPRLTTQPQCYRPTTSQGWPIGVEVFSEDDKQMDVRERLLRLLRDYSSVASLGSQHWSRAPSHPPYASPSTHCWVLWGTSTELHLEPKNPSSETKHYHH